MRKSLFRPPPPRSSPFTENDAPRSLMTPAYLHPFAAALAAVAFTFTLAGAGKKSVRVEKIVFTEQDLGDDISPAKNSCGWGPASCEQTKTADGGITLAEGRSMGTRNEEKPFGVAFSQPHAHAHALALSDLNGDGTSDVLTAAKLGAFVFLNRRHSPKP